MARQALAAFRRTITVQWPRHQERSAKEHLLKVARAGHEEIMAKQIARSGGIAPDWTAYANRPGNTALESVVVPGPIVYRYRYFREIIQFALDALRKASPVVSGDYVRSHTLFINGLPVEKLPLRLDPSDEIFIANPVPYARRLEVGKTTSGRSFVLQVPDRIYERVVKRDIVPRYRNVAQVTFGYVSIPGAYTIKGKLPPRYATKGPGGRIIMRKRRQRVGEKVRAPAIFISDLP